MTDIDLKRVDRIFAEALDQPEASRDAFIASQCAGDESLEAAVRRLMNAVENESGPIDSSLGQLRAELLGNMITDHDYGEELSGTRVGAWQIEHRLARGGLATVYFASRADGTYEQSAAFKVMRRGLDTDDLVARFRAERQILSTLEHPSISRILDGGALDDGRPFLVLEYVDGQSITQFANVQSLSVPERVRLMIPVLQALNHAHRHLVVHRDIKPSNILVTDGGKVSLLDFGIAKLLDPTALPGGAARTRTGLALMTPGYASPEQRNGSAITTATDIYQAGAVLYELLVQERPALSNEIVKPPSRAVNDRLLQRSLSGDLDAIVGKAMREEPEHRYASAMEMLSDLQRYLDGRPVSAQADSVWYRVRKFQQRRPWVIPGVSVVVAVLIGFLVTLVNYNEQAQAAEQRAAAARNFMVDLLRSPDPFRPADPDVGSRITVRSALDLGVEKLQDTPNLDAELRASLLTSIASVYASLDQHQEAIQLRSEALDIEQVVFGEYSQPVLSSLSMLADQQAANGAYQRALEAHQQRLEVARALFGEGHPEVGAAEAAAANFHALLGNFEESEALFDAGIASLRLAGEEYTDDLVQALLDASTFYLNESHTQPERALALIEEAGQLSDVVFGPDGLSAALVHARAAAAYRAASLYPEAGAEYEAAIRIYDEKLGRQHRASLAVLTSYGLFLMATQQAEQSEAVLREVLDGYSEKYDRAHRYVADANQNLATMIRQQGRYEEAIELHQTASEIYAELPLEAHFLSALPKLSIADAYLELNQPAAATAAADEALDVLSVSVPNSYLIGIVDCFKALAAEQQAVPADALWAAAHTRLVDSQVSRHYRQRCRVPTSDAS